MGVGLPGFQFIQGFHEKKKILGRFRVFIQQGAGQLPEHPGPGRQGLFPFEAGKP